MYKGNPPQPDQAEIEQLRILVVDDNPDDRALVVRALKQEFDPVEIFEAGTDAEFRQVAGSDSKFDAVVTDYRLLWSDGLQVLQTVKALCPSCCVHMFTDTGSEEVAVQAMKLGLDDYILKSTAHLHRLTRSIRRCLDLRTQKMLAMQAEARYRNLFAGLPVGLFVAAEDGSFLEINPALARMLGYISHEQLAHASLQTHMSASDYENWLKQLTQEKQVSSYQVELKTLTGTRLCTQCYARIEKGPANVVFVEGCFLDVTAQVAADEAIRTSQSDLLLARDEAIRASEAKSRFLAKVSHEVRTPLNAILGYAELLQETSQSLDPQSLQKDLQKIRSSSEQLLALVDGMLDLAKIDAGAIIVELSEFRLRPLLEQALLMTEHLNRGPRNEIVLQIAPEADVVRADRRKLLQVVVNLLTNACNFTRNGRIVVSAEHQLVSNLPHLVLTVTDNGTGIQQEQLSKVFEPFYQEPGSLPGTRGGTGLGLAISREFCRAMGGDLTAESTPGEGSSFIVKLPQSQ